MPGFLPDSKEVRSDILDYALEIGWFDRHLDGMLRLLEARGELENTIVAVTSDNGMPFPRAKATLYDYGTRMPLAIRWGDRVKPGRGIDDFIGLADLAPTFLEAAGIPVPVAMTGRSLMPLLLSNRSGRVDAERDFAVFGLERHFPGSRPNGAGYPMRAIRTETYLYIENRMADQNPSGDHPGPVWPDDDPTGGFGDTDGSSTKTFLCQRRDAYPELYRLAFGKRPSEELYDVNRDPYNLNNLAGDSKYAGIKKNLAAKLHAYLVQTEDPRETGQGERFDEIMKRFPVLRNNR